MNDTKPFWASWTLWGAVAAFLGILLPNLGIGVSPSDITSFFQSWQNMLNDALTFGGLALTAYGRLSATKQLTAS